MIGRVSQTGMIDQNSQGYFRFRLDFFKFILISNYGIRHFLRTYF